MQSCSPYLPPFVLRSGGIVLAWVLFGLTTSGSAQTGSMSRAADPGQRATEIVPWMDGNAPRRPVLPRRLPSLETGPQATWSPSPERRAGALELVPRTDGTAAVARYKRGFFQRLEFSAEWIDPGGSTQLGVSNFATSLTVAVPLGSLENLLLITPSFEMDLVDARSGIDIPDQLYNTGIDFMWRKQFTDRWGFMAGVTPGYSSDFRNSQDAVRVRGRGFATWQMLPEQLTLLFGVVYLDRNDLPLLPGAGLIWTPTPDWRLDLLFPRPKLAYRFEFLPESHEQWLYLSGQLGGRTWSVTRLGGQPDELTLRDYRLTCGWERIIEGGGGFFAEVGWSFGREMEYEKVPFALSFDEALFIRAGMKF